MLLLWFPGEVRESFKISEWMPVVGWEFQKNRLHSPPLEVTGGSHPSLREASAHIQGVLQLLGVHTDINEKFGTADNSVGNRTVCANELP